MKYQATIKLIDGRVCIGTVEADDKDDAKYQFLHNVVLVDGKKMQSSWIDLRTVKKCSNSLQSKRKET